MVQRSFLQLVVEGAPYSCYEDVLHAALDAAGSPAGIDAVKNEYQLALQVRDLLESRRARQDALRVLLECAKDLADVPDDVDTVLTSIVTRAQRLLGCDLAYLSLNDEERHGTYVRVMVGAIAGEWKDLLIPFGTGIGGMVAAAAAPFVTADYFADDRLVHAPEVDASARAEEQVAILGVPLVHRNHVIGVLYASNRTPGAFSRDAIELLSSFAALAAIAIDQARLLQDKAEALTELRSVHSDLRDRTRDAERAAEAHDRMMGIVLRGGSLQDVVAATAAPLGGRLAIFDEASVPIAWTAETPEADLRAMLDAAAGAGQSGRSVLAGGFWVIGLVAGAESLGTLVWAPEDTADRVSDIDRRLLERAAVVASLLQFFQRNVAAAEAQVRGELLDELLSPSPATYSSLASRARRLRYQPQERHGVMVAQVDPAHRQRLARVTSDLAAARHGLSTMHQGAAVLVLPARDVALTARQVCHSVTLQLNEPVTVGAAGPVSDPAQIPAAFTEATACMNALVALGRAGDSATAGDLGFVGLLLGERFSAAEFVDRALGPVVNHDARRGTVLAQTLEVYYGTGQSLVASAKALHVHPNTVTQRLDRVKRLLGPEWNAPANAVDVQLALRLLRLSQPDQAGQPDPSPSRDA
jgi:DNA-binding PucR family transcriptional regulator/putative methionine-R-sulfoxide reductase with GAF domain